MKKWKEVMKTRGVYIISLFGTITILAVAAIAMNLIGNETKESPGVDLNETPGVVSEKEKNTGLAKETEDKVQLQDKTKKGIEQKEEGDDKQNPESGSERKETADSGETREESVVIPNAKLTDGAALSAEQKADGQQTGEESQAVSGMNPDTVLRSLSFSAEQGLAWPITGAVVLNYSMDHAIYHATLDSYRTNDAVLISGEEGMPVQAAVQGVVTDISEELKTGTTVTMRISEEYSIRYGQLDKVTVKAGDVVEQGESFAVLGKPSKYYTKEGTSLYLQVLQGDTPVNPMLYLKDQE